MHHRIANAEIESKEYLKNAKPFDSFDFGFNLAGVLYSESYSYESFLCFLFDFDVFDGDAANTVYDDDDTVGMHNDDNDVIAVTLDYDNDAVTFEDSDTTATFDNNDNTVTYDNGYDATTFDDNDDDVTFDNDDEATTLALKQYTKKLHIICARLVLELNG